MNLLATTSIFALFASGTNAAGDYEVSGSLRPARRFGTHVWMFGENGVQIFTPDGSKEVKTISPDHVCKNVTSDDGSSRIRCDFNDVVSDGNKYVWATVARGVPKVDVFRIDTGDLVGSFGTCGSPRDLDYHPSREEIWVHCSEFSDIENSHMDVFSAAAPAVPITSTVTLHDGTSLRSFGKLQVHASMGDVAYSTVYGEPYLYKIDLAERRVLKQYDMGSDNPSLFGIYDMAYSSVNGHIYARTEVCCTCGFEGADLLECGRYGSSNITVGDQILEGQCGRHCQGGVTDNIGVLEFDTRTEKIVGTHNFVGDAPVHEPFSSPDGKHIVMFGLNGGRKVEILKAGASGVKSEVEHVIDLDFNYTNVEEYGVFDDFAFVQTNDMNCFIISSSNEYKVAIIDMNTLNVDYVVYKDVPYDGRARGRQVEWAEGTKYVWIGGTTQDEAYVIDIETKSLVRTFTEVDPRRILSVTHHAFNGMANDYVSYMANQNILSTSKSSKSEGTDTLSIVALALSCVAIAAVVASLFVGKASTPKPSKQESAPLTSQPKVDDPSLAVPPSVA